MKHFQSIVYVLLFTGTCLAQESSDKVVSLNVSGEGKTKEEALQVALRGAIEQAFGTFISSNTQVLNDELVKDEIVSIANGNIQKYEILSEVQLQNGQFANTVKATVSVSKLTLFCENKGITVEFKGALFAINVKQQILNEQNELKAIENMRIVLKEIINHSFDFTIATKQPTSLGENEEKWMIPVTIEATLNNNFKNVSSYLFNTLRGVGCSVEEVKNYRQLNKEVYFIVYKPMGAKDKESGLFCLRNRSSYKQVLNLLDEFRNSIFNFTVKNGAQDIEGRNFNDFIASEAYLGRSRSRFKNAKLDDFDFIPVLDLERGTYFFGPPSLRQTKDFWSIVSTNFKFFRDYQFLYHEDETGYNIEYGNYVVISFDNLHIGKSKAIINYIDTYAVDEIQKIEQYKIEVK